MNDQAEHQILALRNELRAEQGKNMRLKKEIKQLEAQIQRLKEERKLKDCSLYALNCEVAQRYLSLLVEHEAHIMQSSIGTDLREMVNFIMQSIEEDERYE